MEKIWLKNYPPNVPPHIQVAPHASLKTLAEESFARYPGLPAFSNLGHTMTYEAVDEASRDLAAYLLARLHLKKGDRVAIILPNVLAFPVTLYALMRAGLVVVSCNPLYTPLELAHQLKDSGARVAIVLENFAHVLAEAIPGSRVHTVLVTTLGDLLPWPRNHLINFVVKYVKRLVPGYRLNQAIPFRRALKEGARASFPDVTLDGSDVALLQYTGGTTGLPKAAVLSHTNLMANVEQCAAMLGADLKRGTEVVITALPLYHIFALTANFLLFTYLGGENVLITNPRDLPGLVKTLREKRFSVLTGVNTLFNGLIRTAGFAALDFTHLRFTLGGGAAVQRAVAARWKAVTGHPIIEGYGLTESSPVVCVNRLDIDEYTGAVGYPLPSTDIAIRTDKGEESAIGEVGELCVRGPQVMREYWNQPDETAQVFTSDGFLRTGDLARIDETGLVYIVDRKKDMILVSGFNVYPNELEGELAHLPGVREVAAIGIPDEQSGETVALFIVPDDASLTREAVMQFCHEHFTGYKRPRDLDHIFFAKELPKTNIGKILRRALREQYLKQNSPISKPP
ncbi:MAG: AMP-binding protein [Gammaproteobacteria bacterium]